MKLNQITEQTIKLNIHIQMVIAYIAVLIPVYIVFWEIVSPMDLTFGDQFFACWDFYFFVITSIALATVLYVIWAYNVIVLYLYFGIFPEKAKAFTAVAGIAFILSVFSLCLVAGVFYIFKITYLPTGYSFLTTYIVPFLVAVFLNTLVRNKDINENIDE